MQWIREKFGAVIVSVIIGLIGLVFVFSGVFNPSRTRGVHEGSVAGTVNGEAITMREYQQSLNQRLEFFKNLGGGKLSEEQLKAFRVHESVFKDLVERKLLIQEARNEGLLASDEEVMQTIQTQYPVFHKDGKFDFMTYRQIISSSPYGSTGAFEKLVREDLSAQRWNDYFRRRIQVSEEEARREYMLSRDKRNVKYVLLTAEQGRKGVEVKAEEIQKYLADPAQLSLAKSQFESKKDTLYKGRTFEAVREEIAREALAGEKMAEVQKVNERLANQIVGILTAGKGADAKVNALLKPYGAEVKTTGMFNRQNPYLPGIGEAKELMSDAFAPKSPIESQAKKYTSAGWTLVAVLTEAQKPDLSKFESDREELVRQLASRKQREVFDAWMKRVSEKAKIDMNADVVSSGA